MVNILKYNEAISVFQSWFLPATGRVALLIEGKVLALSRKGVGSDHTKTHFVDLTFCQKISQNLWTYCQKMVCLHQFEIRRTKQGYRWNKLGETCTISLKVKMLWVTFYALLLSNPQGCQDWLVGGLGKSWQCQYFPFNRHCHSSLDKFENRNVFLQKTFS